MNPNIRPARPDEADLITAITRAAYARWVPIIGREPRPMLADYAEALRKHRIDLIETEGRVLGLIEFRLDPDHLWIENIAVHPDYQGHGLGKLLLAHVDDIARAAALPELRLLTNQAFAANVALYQSRGYTITHTEPFMGGTTLYFSKRLHEDR